MGFDDTLLGSARVRIRPDMDNFARDAEKGATGSGMKKAGMAAGAVFGAAMGASVLTAMQRGAETDKLTAALGMGPADAERMASVSADIYKGAWGDSTAEVNTAIQGVMQQIGGMSTASNADIKATTTQVLDLSKAFGVDATEAAAAVGTMMKNGMAKDATEAFNVITAGFQAGVDKRGDFLDTLTEYSGQFQKLGIDGTMATGLLSQGLAGGARDADKVADALKELSIRAVDGSKSSREAYSALGLDADSMMAKFAAGGDSASGALQTVMDRLRGMSDPVAQSAAAVGLFGTQAEDLGAALFSIDPATAVSAIGQVDGAAAKMGETLNDNAQTKITEFSRKIQDMGLQVVERTGDFGAAAAAIGGFAPAFMSVIGPAAQVSMAMNGISLATARQTFMLGLNKIGWVISQGLYAAQVVGIGAVTIAQWALNAALTANPIGLVVAAIGALIAGFVLLYRNNEGFRNLVQKVWEAIKTAIGGVIDWFSTWVPAAFERAKEIIGAIMDAIGTVIRVVWEAISWYVETYVTIVRTVVETVFNVIRTIIETVMGVISSVIRTAWEAISWYVTTYVNVVKAVVEFVFNAVSAYVGWIMGVISSVISTVWDAITGVWSRGADIVRGITESVMNTARDLFTSGLDGIKGLFSGAVDAIGAIWNRVTDVVKAPIRGMFEWINSNMIGPINTVLGKFSDSVKIDQLPVNFADGGPVRGPGGPRSDSIRANLSNGEFVHTAASYRRFGPLIDAIHAAGSGFGIGGPGVAAQITGWLRGQGMGNAGIAGILGNFQAESSLNPGAIEGGNGEGHGLAQWSFERKQQLFDFAASRGTGWDDLGTQLAFFAGELGAYPEMWESLKTIADPVAASQLFANTFERPGFYGARDEHAAQFFADLESGALNEQSGSSIAARVVAKARSMIRAALEGVANPALDTLGSTFGGAWGPDLVIGMMKHAVGQMAAWAGARDSAANAAGPVVGGPFLGTPGAIGYPLNPWVVTSEFGMRNGVPHQGIDLGAPLGQAVMAAAAGSVARSGWYGGYGNSIMLDHGGGLATTYSHLNDLIATAGQIVSAGEVIGRVGSTGDSTGPHLHFETLSGGGFVNPREFLAFDRGGYLPTGVSAVYNGTGSPEPVFTDRQWQTMGAGQSGGPTINVTNIYPQAEPTSVTTSRALRQYSMVGSL